MYCLQCWCTLEVGVRGRVGTGRGSSAPDWLARSVTWSCCSNWCLSTPLNFLSRPLVHYLWGDSDTCTNTHTLSDYIYYYNANNIVKMNTSAVCCVTELINTQFLFLIHHPGSCSRIITACPVLEGRPPWLRWSPRSQMPVKGSLASWLPGFLGFSRMMRSKVTWLWP